MSLASRRVNQQLMFVQQLLNCIEDDRAVGSSAKKSALLQGAYLQLELSILCYLHELDRERDNGAWVGILHDAFLVDGPLLKKSSAEFCELSLLYHNPDSWLAVFIAQLQSLRTLHAEPAGSKELKGSLFELESPKNKDKNLLSVENITNTIEEPNVNDLTHFVISFKALVLRHRSVNEEY